MDRGPRALDCLSLVRNMVQSDAAICVPGNHDIKLLRKLRGKNVQIKHGLAETLADLATVPLAEQEAFHGELANFLDGLVSHFVLDDGKLVVAHAGMKESLQGRASGKVREFALYGETTGETDEFGLPVRYPWASEYRGDSMVVYGHTPVPQATWLNKTINIDTGCVFGGALTSLRYPELELVSVQAQQTYCEPARPFLPPSSLTAQQQHDGLLDLADVSGKRVLTTRLRNHVTIRAENSTAALEVMSRFAADPKWLIYLPPTMSPSETSDLENYLEHPAEAFSYFRKNNVAQVVCEEKHMGSRAVVVICRDEQAATKRFGVPEEAGIIYTRTGRRFFDDRTVEHSLLERLRSSLTEADFWTSWETDWAAFDCELMPWSAKAQELIRSQYAAVGAAAGAALPAVVTSLQQAAERLPDENAGLATGSAELFEERRVASDKFTAAYQHYCWPVCSIEDYRLAPFHVLATEKRVYSDQNHQWHMTEIAKLCEEDPVLLATPFRVVDLQDESATQQAVDWWCELTQRGGEGMVVKPLDFISQGRDGLLQPAVKCRGPEYLRIIYGADYDAAGNLSRLRKRGLAHKRSLALREFALGMEALERFVNYEPLRRVHECVFGVLALESGPVDPRL